MIAVRRHVLIEESSEGSRIEVIATGEIDESQLEALEAFARRQRRRKLVESETKPPGVIVGKH